jgi:hypothetical protein
MEISVKQLLIICERFMSVVTFVSTYHSLCELQIGAENGGSNKQWGGGGK